LRALTDSERALRQDLLADHALRAFAEVGYSRMTIAALAKRAGVSKGSVFLAFTSKEELALHALGRGFQAWIARLKPLGEQPAAPRALAARVLETLRADPALLPLMARGFPLLEQSCSMESILRLKRTMADELQGLIRAWGPAWPQVPQEAWWGLLMRVHASIVGAWAVSDPPDCQRQAMEQHPELSVFMTRFDDLMLPMVEAQLAAVLHP
jgi:AcrR family transcriptional regulator